MSPLDRLHLVAAHEAPEAVGVPAGTVRYWASKKMADGAPALAARGLDHRGRALYSKADLEQLRDRPRRAAHQRRVDTRAAKPNTRANGTRVFTGTTTER